MYTRRSLPAVRERGHCPCMAELDGTKRHEAAHAAPVDLMPGQGEAGAQDISTSREYTVAPGEYWTLSCHENFFVATHATAATATASSTPLAAGRHSMTVPTGVTRLAIFSSVSGAKGAAWKS